MFERLRAIFSDDYSCDDDYRAAVDFKEHFEPKDGCDYDWVWEYAEQSFIRLEETLRQLDAKADRIITYLGGGVGLLTVGALATLPDKLNAQTTPLLLWAIPGAVLAGISLILAALARKPAPTLHPPSIEGAIKYAEGFDKKAKAVFRGQWHATCEGVRLAAQRKANRVRGAALFFAATVFWGFIFLAIMVCEIS